MSANNYLDGLTIDGVAYDLKDPETDSLRSALNDATETIENLGYATAHEGYTYSAGVYVSRKSNYQLNVYGTADGWGKFECSGLSNQWKQSIFSHPWTWWKMCLPDGTVLRKEKHTMLMRSKSFLTRIIH